MTLVLSSTGHAGMECVMTNLLEKDDVVLIANHGIWGERAMDMARRQGELIFDCKLVFKQSKKLQFSFRSQKPKS